MRKLRIDLTNGQVSPYSQPPAYQEVSELRDFWAEWNGWLTRAYWHRIELDRDGNPYTVKWYSWAYRNRAGAWAELTMAMEVDGEHPADTRPQPEAPDDSARIPATQRGRLSVGEHLRSPQGTWTVAEAWIANKAGAQGNDRQYGAAVSGGDHMYYLLTHEDGHQEEWSAPDMADADFHRILPDEQQTLT